MIKNLIKVFALSLLFSTSAKAVTMSLFGPSFVMTGDTFQVQILGDFSGVGLLAGGIVLSWDAAHVQLDEVQLDLPNPSPDFSCPGSDNCPASGPNNTTLVWGAFINPVIFPDEFAPTLMATLTFTVIFNDYYDPIDILTIFGMRSADELTGGWFGPNYVPIDAPSFSHPVPLPSAIWLMIGGLLTLPGLRSFAH